MLSSPLRYVFQANFTVSEPRIVLHPREKDQQDAHFFFIIYFT